MTDSKDQVSQQAQALLALGLTREHADFRVPADEELARLLDPQSAPLDDTRKAQIMDAIANDPATFARWMSLVDAAETLEIGHFSPETVQAPVAASKPSMFARLGAALSNNLRAVLATGGATAMAMGLAIVFMLPVGMDSRVSGLYDDFGQQWASKPEKLDMIRGGERAAQPLSAEDQRLQQGVLAGQQRLGEEFKVRNLNMRSTTDTSQLDDALSESLFRMGQVAAISHFKCLLGADDTYFEASWTLINELVPALREADDATSQALVKAIDRQGSAETQVCRVAKATVARVTQ